MRSYGSVRLEGDAWRIACEPHVAIRLKQVCSSIAKRQVGVFWLSNTPEHCRELAWFIQRYPLDVDQPATMAAGAEMYEERVLRLADLVSGHTPPPAIPLALPPRPYQAQAAAVARAAGGLLLADDVGVGKTCTGIAAVVDPAFLPAVVVAPAHLLRQWAAEFARFAPHLRVYTTPGTKPKPLGEPGPDVIITNYHRLHGWAQVFAAYCRSVIYDEVHELRRPDSGKYEAARLLAGTDSIRLRLGLSATPIFNYGGEFFHVLGILAPGRLGSHEEFLREWCSGTLYGDKAKIANPEAFGAHLRDQGLMLRRTRAEIGRELPPVTTVVQPVDAQAAALAEVGEQVRSLAMILLGQTGATTEERWKAGGELDWRLRQATGIAKAANVAAFVQMLVESGEPVVLLGWHRAVYDIWADCLTRAGLRVASYTGEESESKKAAAAAAWRAGELDVLLLSLRSGAGLDGLQERGSVVVFGELDWSPAVHEQCIGRLHRDGQDKSVVAYYLVAEDGADPVMAEVLGLKRTQLDGIRRKDGDPIAAAQGSGDHVKRLAERFLTHAQRRPA